MQLTLNPPPPTPVEPVTEILHGIPVTDPYRWLEDQNSPCTRKWLEEQSSYTRAYLAALPGRARIRKRVEKLLAVEVITEPWKVGNRYFYLKRSPHQEQPVIMMREAGSDKEVVLVDPAKRSGSNTTTVNIVSVSREGDFLAYGVSNGAHSFKSIEILDVPRRRVLTDHLPPGFNAQLHFLPDGQAFLYSSEFIDGNRPNYRAVYLHKLGTKSQEDLELFFAGEDSKIHIRLLPPADGNLFGYVITRSAEYNAFDFHVHDVTAGRSATRVVEQMESVFQPVISGTTVLALTDWNAPNLRIVAIDLQHPEKDRWVDIIPESQYPIRDFAFVGGFVCVGYLGNVSSKIEIFDRCGHRCGRVPCPPLGSARLLSRPPENETLMYAFSAFDHPPTIFSYHIPTKKHTIWAKSLPNFDRSSLEVEQVHYESRDGTEIPMFLVSKKGKRLSGPLPTFLGAYGGFGISRPPQFNVYSTFLVEQDCLFAFAHLRGGGEFGEEWHRAGKRHNRQNAFDDFIAAAQWLISHGLAVRGKIAIGGGSNAGLLTGVALTQRPDLFRAAISMGPLLDMVRYHRFDSAHLFVDEYGTPERQDDFHHLFAYSPYHHVEDGVAYPAVMLVSGDEDTCCNPMHTRKMAARLQAASSSGHPILLDYKPTWGHASVQPLTQRIEALTDRLAFICYELGVTV